MGFPGAGCAAQGRPARPVGGEDARVPAATAEALPGEQILDGRGRPRLPAGGL